MSFPAHGGEFSLEWVFWKQVWKYPIENFAHILWPLILVQKARFPGDGRVILNSLQEAIMESALNVTLVPIIMPLAVCSTVIISPLAAPNLTKFPFEADQGTDWVCQLLASPRPR